MIVATARVTSPLPDGAPDVCRIVDTTLELNARAQLRASPEGPVLSDGPGRLGSLEATATVLFRRHTAGANIVAVSDGITFRAIVDPLAVAVYPTSPVAVGDYYVSLLHRSNPWHYSPESGAFDATFAAPEGVLPRRALPRVTLRCSEVSLRVPPWSGYSPSREILDGFGFDPALSHHVATRTGTNVPLATKPGGEPVATLDSSEGLGLAAYDERDGFLHVAWDVDDGLVFGWIPLPFVDPHGAHRTRPPAVRMGAVQFRSDRWYRCGHEIPLFVTLAGSRFPVGVIGFNPGRFSVVTSAPDLTTIETRATAGLPLVHGAELVIRTSDLGEDCERTSMY
jgi:hypothetical protein